jgi:hypothetical protein
VLEGRRVSGSPLGWAERSHVLSSLSVRSLPAVPQDWDQCRQSCVVEVVLFVGRVVIVGDAAADLVLIIQWIALSWPAEVLGGAVGSILHIRCRFGLCQEHVS